MKWPALIIVLAAIIPLSQWLRRNPRETPKIWMLMGFLPFTLIFHLYPIFNFHLNMAIDSWPEWPGYVKGAEFSVLDALALAVYISLPSTSRPLPFRFSMICYFLAALLSTLQAKVPEAALFYPWQLARMFLVYAVVARGCADPRVAPALLRGMAAALFMEACIAIWERFGLGVLQVHGTLEHQNGLGMLSHLIVLPFFALLLTRRRGWLPATVFVAGVVIQLLTISRATIGLAAFGYLGVFTLSALRQWTSRKARLLLVGVALAAIAVPLAFLSFEHRFAGEDSLDDYDERAVFETVASMILSDHPWGVGVNQYVLVANIDGYNVKAGVAPMKTSEMTNVHNVYWLVAAESGYVGLITFILLLLNPLIVAFRCGLRYRGDDRSDLLIGLGMALLVVYVQSFFEWFFITFQFQYMFAIVVGLVAGLAGQLGYWRSSNSPPVRPGVSTTRKNRETYGLSRRILK